MGKISLSFLVFNKIVDVGIMFNDLNLKFLSYNNFPIFLCFTDETAFFFGKWMVFTYVSDFLEYIFGLIRKSLFHYIFNLLLEYFIICLNSLVVCDSLELISV